VKFRGNNQDDATGPLFVWDGAGRLWRGQELIDERKGCLELWHGAVSDSLHLVWRKEVPEEKSKKMVAKEGGRGARRGGGRVY